MNEQRWQDWVTTLVGVYVFLSPWIIPYVFPASIAAGLTGWSHYIAGAAIVVVGVAALADYKLWEEWVDLALGAWLIISPWVIGFSGMTALAWNAVIAGAIVVILSAWALLTSGSTIRMT